MRTLITGAAGMLGRKLVERLAREGAEGPFLLVDVVAPPVPPELAGRAEAVAVDIAAPGVAARMVADRPALIFHLAAVVSGEAEADFDKGQRINFDATRALLDAIRSQQGYCPRFVFASSIAVFGAPFPDRIPDDFLSAPRTSYGIQKAMGELLVNDYSRRGWIDGVSIRLPTLCIRPGAPNKAASGFFSNILREPLAGLPAVLPVPETVRHWHASPRSGVGFLIHAATMDSGPLGARRALTMPGVSATVAEQIEALRRAAGDRAVALIRREHDDGIAAMVAGWPQDFAPERALAFGFRAETEFDQIIAAHVEDELGGRHAFAEERT
ncbi:MAG: D-erythronate dehydrogenase [Gemmobacter sp.]